MNELSLGCSALLTDLAMCVNYYRLFSPGLYCCVHAPVLLNSELRLRPGLIAMVNYGKHKQCDPEPDYVEFKGPPNFVLDVFPANDWRDYKQLRAQYESAGVIEYVAVRDTDPLEWIWNRRNDDGQFDEIDSDHEDLILSGALPGFWIPQTALRQRDWWTIMSKIARGVTREGHHRLMDSIWNASD